MLNRNQIKEHFSTTYLIGFFTLGGYFSFQIFFLSLGVDNSRSLTIPLRILISFLMISSIVKSRKLILNSINILPIIFWFFYILKAIFNLDNNQYNIPTKDFIYFTLSFSIIPFFYFQNITSKEILNIKKGFKDSAVILVVVGTYYYLDLFLKGVGRLDMAVYLDDKIRTISPLSIAYTSAYIITISTIDLIVRKNKFKSIVLILLSTIPFLLGASRGALIVVAIPVIIKLVTSGKIKTLIRGLLSILFFLLFIVLIDSNNGGGFLNRISLLLSINKENPRILLWKSTFEQFSHSPLFGNGLSLYEYNSYPHNIILEAFLTTGVLVGSIFLLFSILFFKKSVKVFSKTNYYNWITILAIQSFIQSMVSGNIYSSIWFWASCGLLYNKNLFNGE